MYQTITVNSKLQYLYRYSVVRDTHLVIDGDGPWLKPSLTFFQSIRKGQVTHTSCFRSPCARICATVWRDHPKKNIRYLSSVGPAMKMLHEHLSLCEDSSYYVLSVDQSKHNMLTHVDLKLDNHPGSRVPSRVLDVCDRERTWIIPGKLCMHDRHEGRYKYKEGQIKPSKLPFYLKEHKKVPLEKYHVYVTQPI